MNPVIYFDNNATTPIDKEVLDAMMPFLTHNFGNASSSHHFGVIANDAVKEARQQIANFIGARINEVVFTSGATEGINQAIKGIAEKYSDKGNHIITVKTEHSAVLDTCQALEEKGFRVTYLDVLPSGLIDLEELKASITEQTILVSIMYVNNETGIIQPIKDIAQITHEAGALFMTDATQAMGKLPIDVQDLDIDIMPFSGHKIYGPKGVGALFIKQRSPRFLKVSALLHGGGHEKGYRSGTLNVPGIAGLGAACRLAKERMSTDTQRIMKLRDSLEKELLKVDGVKINGDVKNRLFNVLNLCFEGADSDALIVGLGRAENGPPIAVSNGSACTSTSIEPSHVLKAMGLTDQDCFSTLRFSLGRFNTMHEVTIVSNRVKKVVSALREMVKS